MTSDENWTPERVADFEADWKTINGTTHPATPATGPTIAADYRGATWQPVDLGPYLRGEVTHPEPTIGIARLDGLRLIYPGREHVIMGEMESGKSWFSVACAKVEMLKGNRVLYIHFEEADPADTVTRLLAIDTPASVIEKLFTFVGPGEPADKFALPALLDPVPSQVPTPSLVILDGVNEAMSLHGLSPRDEGDAAEFRRLIVKPCTAAGAATIAGDHVVKDKEARGRGPLGSVHKGNGLTGSLILLENTEPFGQGERGCSYVYVTKDRPGSLRRHGKADRRTPGRTYMGALVVDDTKTDVPWTDVTFIDPQDRRTETAAETQPPRDDTDEELVLGVVADLNRRGITPSTRITRAAAKGISDRRVDKALTRLVLDGRLTQRPGPRDAHLFTVADAPTPQEEP